jgi:hypothetical protein
MSVPIPEIAVYVTVFDTVMIARMITATARTIPRTNGSLVGSGDTCPLLARQMRCHRTLEGGIGGEV